VSLLGNIATNEDFLEGVSWDEHGNPIFHGEDETSYGSIKIKITCISSPPSIRGTGARIVCRFVTATPTIRRTATPTRLGHVLYAGL
jgi:hypothetical protein